ncbi:MAG: thioesterase family protein [Acidimicrobiia bacterium]|jgi:acyl-CoA thioesterase
MPTRFQRDTAVERADDGSYGARLDPAWGVQRGPNGGYLAAVILRAMTATVDDPTRAPRSLTIHYAAPPEEREVVVRTSIERAGRSLTSVSARMTQDDRTIAIAMAAFSKPREGPEFCDLEAPDVPPPERLAAPVVHDEAPPIARRWDVRWAVGEHPFEGEQSHEALGGGWIRLEEPQQLDATAVAALTDAWIPPVFSRTKEPLVVPTIDLTVHFRAALPHAGLPDDGFLLAVFRTRAAAEGFLEEDGEVWAADGTLLAQSRQLAAILPMR